MTDNTARATHAPLSCFDFTHERLVSDLKMSELHAIISRHAADEVAKELARLDKRMDARFDELERLLSSAFPEGDPGEHRRYHEEIMAYMADKRALWRAIREKTLTGLVWAGLIALGSSVWHYVKVKLLGAP